MWKRHVNGVPMLRTLGEDRAQAIKKAEELNERLRRAELSTERLTVKQAWDRFKKQHVEVKRRNERDRAIVDARFRKHVEPVLGRLMLDELRRRHLFDLRARLARPDTKLKPLTQKGVMVELNLFLRWCQKADLVAAPPLFEPGDMPRVQERLADRLTDEEAERLKSLPEPWGFYCRFGLGTGLRWSELCRAQASDIDWTMEIPVLRVLKSKTYYAREVPIRPWLAGELRAKAGRLFPFEPTTGDNTKFNRMIKRLSGITEFHAHRMRHTFCCQLGNDGMPTHLVMRVMGHRRIETTLRYLRQGDDAARREAQRVFERLAVSESVSSEGRG